MDQKDRLAYEVAMIELQDVREDCLRWLDDRQPVTTSRTATRWWSLGPRPTPPERPLAS